TYIAIAKLQLEGVQSIITQIGAGLGQIADGATGSGDGDDGETFTYSKTDSDTWSITITKNSTVTTYIDVNGSTYTLEADASAEGDGAFGKIQIVVTYTDADTWELTTTMLGGACSDDDVRAPSNFRIHMELADGLWKGKAMMYMPRWAESNPTCASTPDDVNGFNLYSDFVGDADVAKMNVYAMTRNESTVTGFPLSDFCTEFPGMCTGGSVGSETPADYDNSVCIETGESTGTWNSSCTAQAPASSAVPAATFGDASDWVAPNDFYDMTITVGP
ncbi:MAG: hypothetical protein AB7O96_17890, partial [Pseudobdellovibrionaceae bacterium]